MIPSPLDLQSLAPLTAALQQASPAERVAWLRTLGRAALRHLYTLAEGQHPMRAEDFLAGREGIVTWQGRNSLPLFNDFAKAFARHQGRIQGYNINTGLSAWFGGPGHFITRDNPDRPGEPLFDYVWEADSAPAGFPPLASNLWGTYRLVYGNTVDLIRQVAPGVIVSEATKHGKPLGVLFALVLED